jgi:hypothetical protein
MPKKKASVSTKPEKQDGAADKKKGGRPKKEEQEHQTNVIAVRFSDARYQQISDRARKRGKRKAVIVKEWLEKGAPADLTAEQHACLRSLPSIRNDLAAILHLFRQQPDRRDEAVDLTDLNEQLRQLLLSFAR